MGVFVNCSGKWKIGRQWKIAALSWVHACKNVHTKGKVWVMRIEESFVWQNWFSYEHLFFFFYLILQFIAVCLYFFAFHYIIWMYLYTRQKFQVQRWYIAHDEIRTISQRGQCNNQLHTLWSNCDWNLYSGCSSATNFLWVGSVWKNMHEKKCYMNTIRNHTAYGISCNPIKCCK